MKIVKEIFENTFLLEPKIQKDNRGIFVKSFFENYKIKNSSKNFLFRDEFFTYSKKNVIRGMHFQTPPHDHDKLVTCINGSALDVLLDLRKGDQYGNVYDVKLTSDNNYFLFIPKGVAHGFLSLEDNTILLYKTTTPHSISHDSGILWNSFNFDWLVNDPIISSRDQSHLSFRDFESPF